ncbi:MAG: hypothetical protein ABIS26_00060 [Candidatus Paceibacterota bacterium]
MSEQLQFNFDTDWYNDVSPCDDFANIGREIVAAEAIQNAENMHVLLKVFMGQVEPEDISTSTEAEEEEMKLERVTHISFKRVFSFECIPEDVLS